MTTTNDFIEWALSPDRTLEEAYCAERLVERGVQHWESLHKTKRFFNWEKRRAKEHRRKLNPAHRLKLKRPDVEKAVEALSQLKSFDFDSYNDRPVRDISALRFFPHFEELRMGHSEVRDLSPLRAMKQLRKIWISNNPVDDLSPLSACVTLEEMNLWASMPWPRLQGLEVLTRVRKFEWTGNLLALEEIPQLIAVREAKFSKHHSYTLPLRNCERLPAMPDIEFFEIEGVHRLDGIERYPKLRNLKVDGTFEDLRPLTSLRALTHLTLAGNVTYDLSPLAQLPELRRIEIQGERPQDYSVLAEAPKLHEVHANGCQINQMELATLHAVLSSWDEEFAAPEPRPLRPFQFKARPYAKLHPPARAEGSPNETWFGDKGMGESEGRWMKRRLEAALARVMGKKKWGCVSDSSGPGYASVSLTTTESAERLPEVVEISRDVIAGTRFPWQVHIHVNLDDEDEDDEELSPEEEARQHVEEMREYEAAQKERAAYLEREHRMKLLAQDGQDVNPDDFAPPGSEPVDNAVDSDLEQYVPEPENVVDLFESKEAEEDRLFIYAVVTEEGLSVCDNTAEAAEHLMKRKAEREPAEAVNDERKAT